MEAQYTKILLDLSSIKSGGGAQLALNFVRAVNSGKFSINISAILISNKFPFNSDLNGSYTVISIPSNPILRIIYELFFLKRRLSSLGISHVYTLFGPGLPAFRAVRRIVGMAYPTLLYNESLYWTFLPITFRVKKKMQNLLRTVRLKSADHVIFETEVMANRAIAKGLVSGRSSVLQPTPTSFLSASELPPFDLSGVNILFPAGLDPHKNLWRLPGVLSIIDQEDIRVRMYLTVEKAQFFHTYGIKEDSRLGNLVDKYVVFLGALPPDKLQSAYNMCNVVGNISDLESFSNNYMEAWLAGRPILASDRDFSRQICGASALYVEPHDVASLAAGIRTFAQCKVDVEGMINAGREALSRLPTMSDRLSALSKIIECV